MRYDFGKEGEDLNMRMDKDFLDASRRTPSEKKPVLVAPEQHFDSYRNPTRTTDAA